MEMKKVSRILTLRRLASLKKGDLTDCSFLVGPDNPNCPPQEIRAWKYDLMVASEYFHPLLANPYWNADPSKPIRINNKDPEIFKLIVEFTHLSGQLVTEVNDLKQCLKLAAAVDEYMLDDLGQVCTEKLEELITLDNVWTVFSLNHKVRFSSSACEKTAFLKIDENALAKFLGFEKMRIKSELQLVNACLRYFNAKKDKRALFRRFALPHLRLLTLTSVDDLSQLATFLEKEVKMLMFFFFQEKDPLQIKNDLLASTTLCKLAKPRESVFLAPLTVDFWPDREYLGYGSKVCKDDYHRNDVSKYELIVEAHDSIKITGIDILSQISHDLFADNLLTSMNNEQAVRWLPGSQVSVTGSNLSSIVYLKPLKCLDLCTHLESSILVAKGEKVTIAVILNNSCYVRNVLAKDIVAPEVTCSITVTRQPLVGRGSTKTMPLMRQNTQRNYVQMSGYIPDSMLDFAADVQPKNSVFKCLYYEKVL